MIRSICSLLRVTPKFADLSRRLAECDKEKLFKKIYPSSKIVPPLTST